MVERIRERMKRERDRFDRIVELVNWSSVRVYFFEGNDASE